MARPRGEVQRRAAGGRAQRQIHHRPQARRSAFAAYEQRDLIERLFFNLTHFSRIATLR